MIDVAGSPITRSLVTRLTPMLHRMAQRRVRREDVDDVVQETWLSAVRSVSRYEGRSSIAVWIVGILKRRIADSCRRERPGHVLLADVLACDGMLAPERMQHAQLVMLVEAALAELPELERAALRLCDLQGAERAEAARSLGISPGYLRVALHRARHRLAGELRRQEVLAGGERLCANAPVWSGRGGV
jgi:RNA polymerase sigma-70 factor (ECF subfamily)